MNKLAIKLYRKHFPVGPNPITHGIEPSPSSFNWNTKSIFGFFDRNVYDKVLLEFVRLLPYNSTEDFLQRRMDRKKYPFLFLVALSLLLNIIRLFLMVVTSTPNMYWFLTGFFNGLNGNRREWILVITNIFLTGFTVKCALVWVDLKPRFLYCFELLFKLSAITKRSKKTDHIVRLEKLVNIYWTINLWLRLSLVVFVIGFSIYEPIRGFYGQVDFFFLIRLLLWTATMHSGVYFSCTIGIALSAMFLSVIHYHNMQYKQFCRLFNWKLTLWISVPRNKRIDRDIQVLLKQFQTLNQSTWKVSKEFSVFLFLIYYMMMITLDGMLLILIDSRTEPLIKLIASHSSLICFTIVFGALSFVTSLSYYAGKLSTPLDRCLFLTNPSTITKFKILEVRSQLNQQMIGIRCKNIFTFTLQKICSIALNFIFNFFLVVKLFRNYFF